MSGEPVPYYIDTMIEALKKLYPDLLPDLPKLDPDVAGAWIFRADASAVEDALRRFAELYQEKRILKVEVGKVVDPPMLQHDQQFVLRFWRQNDSDPRLTERKIEANIYTYSVQDGTRVMVPPCGLPASPFIHSFITWCKLKWPLSVAPLELGENMEEYLWQREGTPFWQIDIPYRLEDISAAWWMYFVNRYTILSSTNNILSIEVDYNCVFTIRRDPSVEGIALYALQVTLRGDNIFDLAAGIVQFRSLVNGRTRITLGTRLPLHARIEALPVDQELPANVEETRSAFEDHQAKVYEWQKATLLEHVSAFLAWFQADQQSNSATSLSAAESSDNTDSERQPAPQKRRSGGRKTATMIEKRAVVEGWLAVQAHDLQEVYCADKGISPSTLRRWARELGYTV